MNRPGLRLKRWGWVAAAIVVGLIALGLRLRAVKLLPIDYDEDDYLRAGLQYAQAIRQGDWKAFAELNYRPEHPPLAKIVYGIALARLPAVPEPPDRPTTSAPASSLPQPHLRTARTVAAVAGALETLLLALLNPLAGLLLAVHTFTIKYTSQVMLEAVPALTSAAAVLAYDRSRRRLGGWLVLSAVALGLTAASKYVFCIVAVAILIHWLREARSEAAADGKSRLLRLWPVVVWAVVAMAVFLAADPYLWPAPLQRLRKSVLYHAAYTQSANVREAGFPIWQPLVWISESVPWHPGVFLIAIDGLIGLLALVGLRSLWQRNRLYGIWLAVALVFLLAWPTKWPQYILVLTFPLSLAAAEGIRTGIWQPAVRWIRNLRTSSLARPQLSQTRVRRELVRALPWLLVGTVVLVLITYYPLLYQGGIALTDFGATSIKDGVRGGIWREVREGLAGTVEPAEVDIFSGRPTSTEVHYTGFGPLRQLLGGAGSGLLVFEALWTVLSVGLQTALGVGAALLLHQRGVRLKGWWQTIFILPWAIPQFVGALIWMQIFDPRFGWFFLGGSSFPETPGYLVAQQLAVWQTNPNAALLVLLIAGTWAGFPLIMLAASAGLKLIPAEVFDAAAIDGASSRQAFRSITWPLLLPLLAPVLIIRGIAAFNEFYLFWVLNPPLATLASLSYAVFGTGRYALSALINLLTVLVLTAFLLLFNRWSRAGEGVTYA
jgi:ABC-type sugar transport system permease subunit